MDTLLDLAHWTWITGLGLLDLAHWTLDGHSLDFSHSFGFGFGSLGLWFLVLDAGGWLCGGSHSSGSWTLDSGLWTWLLFWFHSGKAHTVGYSGHGDSGTATKE